MTASGGAAGSGGSLPNSCRSKPQLLTPFFFWLRAAERGGGRTHCWGFRSGVVRQTRAPLCFRGSLICPSLTCVSFSQRRHRCLCADPALLCWAPASHSGGKVCLILYRKRAPFSYSQVPWRQHWQPFNNPKIPLPAGCCIGTRHRDCFLLSLFFYTLLPLIFFFNFFSFYFPLSVSLSHLLSGVSEDTAMRRGFGGQAPWWDTMGKASWITNGWSSCWIKGFFQWSIQVLIFT